jgi:hypothetical protein
MAQQLFTTLAHCLSLQVGQLSCAGLAHSYSLCASVGVTSGPLLSALRKATRVKLRSFEPAELVTIMSSLAALGQQDLLYLDELSQYVNCNQRFLCYVTV